MESGPSRALFELWCDDEKNGVLITGYTIEGTLVHKLDNEMKTAKIFKNSKEENREALSATNTSNEFSAKDGRKKKVLCSVDNISFSAHVSFPENLRFMSAVKPKSVMLVHGKSKNIYNIEKRLRSATHWIVDDGSEKAKAAMALLAEQQSKLKVRITELSSFFFSPFTYLYIIFIS